MKERREEDNKGNKLPEEIVVNPYIFAGLEKRKQFEISRKVTKIDEEQGYYDALELILEITNELTGYTADQLRQETKGRIGLVTVRQAFIIASYEAVGSKSAVARFINRIPSSVTHTCNEVGERIGTVGYELLTSIYTDIKTVYNERRA